MRAQQVRQFDMLRRVQEFLATWAAKLGGIGSTPAKQELDSLVQEMATSESEQATSTLAGKSETATLTTLRRDLLKHHMRPVATIAAAHLKDVPGFDALQYHPKVTLAKLVQDAIAMADAARPHQDVFVQNGRPANFADALVAAANALRVSVDARGASITQKAAARDGLKSTASRIHVVLRLLDAQVKSLGANDSKLLGAWKSARRIGKGKVVPIEATIPPEATTPTGQTPVTSTTPPAKAA